MKKVKAVILLLTLVIYAQQGLISPTLPGSALQGSALQGSASPNGNAYLGSIELQVEEGETQKSDFALKTFPSGSCSQCFYGFIEYYESFDDDDN